MATLALTIAASGAHFQQGKLDVAANNLAQDRPGYREKMMIGASNEYVVERRPGDINATNGALLPIGIQKGTGIREQAIVANMALGNLVQTGNPYNIAIQGKGFFQIELPNGDIAYTLDGTFTLDQDRNLVTQEGYPVSPAITIPANTEQVTINGNGDVLAKIAGTLQPQNVGTIQTVTFPNEEGLLETRDNMLLETPSSGAPIAGVPGEDDRGRLMQGYYRGSNMEPTKQVVSLIEIQRAYEMNMKVTKAASEMMSTTTQAA